ncbi:1 metastasis-suppressor [Sigmodon hispidus]
MRLQLQGRSCQEDVDDRRISEIIRTALDGYWGGGWLAPDVTARRQKAWSPRRVWEGRGGIVPGDVTHLDFIKGTLIREPESEHHRQRLLLVCSNYPSGSSGSRPPSGTQQGHIVEPPLPARMTSLASWQLLLLCATTFGEPLAKVTPVVNPGPTGGQRPGPQELINVWERGPRCSERKPGVAGLRPRRISPCPPVESSTGRQRPMCTARSRLIPAPRGAVLVQREKDLSTYNWNSFGLRYGRRQAARAARAARAAGAARG